MYGPEHIRPIRSPESSNHRKVFVENPPIETLKVGSRFFGWSDFIYKKTNFFKKPRSLILRAQVNYHWLIFLEGFRRNRPSFRALRRNRRGDAILRFS